MYRLLIPLLISAICALNLTGCSGEIYLGTRQIDQWEETRTMKEKPAYCRLFSCKEVPNEK